jgi:AcrR family transcriptional regulator
VQSRRERLLAAASRLFAAQGYAAVTVDAIGEAAGIAGPSVYNHYASKQDLLVAVVHRGNEWMWMELSRAFAEASDERAAMARLLDAYLTLVVERGELGNVLAGDLGYLPEDVQAQARQSQQDYVREWVALLGAADSGLTSAEARLRIQAAFTIINTTAQTPHLARAAGSTALLRSVVDAILGLV